MAKFVYHACNFRVGNSPGQILYPVCNFRVGHLACQIVNPAGNFRVGMPNRLAVSIMEG